jgi:hypothetical protein
MGHTKARRTDVVNVGWARYRLAHPTFDTFRLNLMTLGGTLIYCQLP